MIDAVIIGGGIAGLTIAAIFLYIRFHKLTKKLVLNN